MEVKKGRYKHFKGKEYQVIGVARHSETLEEYVVYHAVHDQNEIWIRPKEMFLEEIERAGKKMRRFTFIDAE